MWVCGCVCVCMYVCVWGGVGGWVGGCVGADGEADGAAGPGLCRGLCPSRRTPQRANTYLKKYSTARRLTSLVIARRTTSFTSSSPPFFRLPRGLLASDCVCIARRLVAAWAARSASRFCTHCGFSLCSTIIDAFRNFSAWSLSDFRCTGPLPRYTAFTCVRVARSGCEGRGAVGRGV